MKFVAALLFFSVGACLCPDLFTTIDIAFFIHRVTVCRGDRYAQNGSGNYPDARSRHWGYRAWRIVPFWQNFLVVAGWVHYRGCAHLWR